MNVKAIIILFNIFFWGGLIIILIITARKELKFHREFYGVFGKLTRKRRSEILYLVRLLSTDTDRAGLEAIKNDSSIKKLQKKDLLAPFSAAVSQASRVGILSGLIGGEGGYRSGGTMSKQIFSIVIFYGRSSHLDLGYTKKYEHAEIVGQSIADMLNVPLEVR